MKPILILISQMEIKPTECLQFAYNEKNYKPLPVNNLIYELPKYKKKLPLDFF